MSVSERVALYASGLIGAVDTHDGRVLLFDKREADAWIEAADDWTLDVMAHA